jgi:replicative DNA helicase
MESGNNKDIRDKRKRNKISITPQQLIGLGKLPPSAVDLEEAVLGAIMLDKGALANVIDILKPATFYKEAHILIYTAIQSLFNDSDAIDILTVTQRLKKEGNLENAGGAFYVTQLTNRIASSANVEVHARIIIEKFLQRELIRVCTNILQNSYEDSTDVFELMEKSENELFSVSQDNIRKNYETIQSLLGKAIKQIEDSRDQTFQGIPSGFTRLDAITGGWQNSDLIILGARPAMGKCFGKGTRIMMYDGCIKNVEDIKTGDVLMGNDSTPRNVLSTTSGREMMYNVKQLHGIDYRVNESHILSLKNNSGDVANIEVREYLKKSSEWKNNYKGYRVDIRDIEVQALTPISVEQDIVDIYYGFTLDGNRLFLLEDCTVVHNTALMMALARNASVRFKKPVAIFSLEMTSLQLVMRLIASETEFSSEKLRQGQVSTEEFQFLNEKITELAHSPLFIDDTPSLSLFEFKAKAKRLKSQHDISMIVIDYLQLMVGGEGKGNREQEVGLISRSLKAIAKELNIPIIALSQLSRMLEQRGGTAKRPQLSDLRESGQIEQDADLVAFIHRPEYYGILEDENGNSTQGLAEIVIAKHRNGRIGIENLMFIPHLSKFVEPSYSLFNNQPDQSSPQPSSSHQNTGEPKTNSIEDDF